LFHKCSETRPFIVNSGGTSESRSGSSSTEGKGSSSYSSSVNHNWSQTKRSMLEPAEVIALDPRVAITFHPSVRPIISWLVRYYEYDFSRGNGISVLRAMGETLCLFLTATIFAIAAVAMAFKGGW
jgi:type IV secretion system protein VirD4